MYANREMNIVLKYTHDANNRDFSTCVKSEYFTKTLDIGVDKVKN
jgi:hypothetical protein